MNTLDMADADLTIGTLDDSHQTFVFLNVASGGEAVRIIQDFQGTEVTILQSAAEVCEAIADDIGEFTTIVQLSPAFVAAVRPFLLAFAPDEAEWCLVTIDEQPAVAAIAYANADELAAQGKAQPGWYWFHRELEPPLSPEGPFETWMDACRAQARNYDRVFARMAAGITAED